MRGSRHSVETAESASELRALAPLIEKKGGGCCRSAASSIRVVLERSLPPKKVRKNGVQWVTTHHGNLTHLILGAATSVLVSCRTISTSFGCGLRSRVRDRRRNDCPGFACVRRRLAASLGSACPRFDPASLSLEMPLLDSFAWLWAETLPPELGGRGLQTACRREGQMRNRAKPQAVGGQLLALDSSWATTLTEIARLELHGRLGAGNRDGLFQHFVVAGSTSGCGRRGGRRV
jgi:hypothetical protein